MNTHNVLKRAGAALGMLALALPALAQGTGDAADATAAPPPPPPPVNPMVALMHNTTGLGWTIAAAFVAWVFAMGITAAFGSKGNPLTVARVGCWFGATLWTLFFLLYVLGRIIKYSLPVWGWLIVAALIALLGFWAGSHSRRTVHA
jgi:hypothetical protein